MKKPFFLAPYAAAWRLARPLLRRHKRLAEGFEHRLVGRDWPEDLLPAICGVDTVHPPFRLWIHAASGGEAYLAWQIVGELSLRLKDLAVICTSMTKQGIEVLGKMQQELSNNDCFIAVSYFPLDEPGLMRRALEQAFGPPSQAPRAVALLETEIWPGLLSACRAYGVRSYILNGRMTEGSLKSYGHIRGTLRSIAPGQVMAISAEDAERFRAVFDEPGRPSRVSVAPNIKFDRVAPVEGERKNALRGLVGADGTKIALFASVREEEEEDIMALIAPLRKEHPECCVIVAPRHLHRAAHWVDTLSGMLAGTSHFKMRSKGVNALEAGDVVLWDAFGELMDLYELSTAVFVGGSLAPLGGQNFLEPLSFGLVPVTGPSWSNFYWVGQEIFDLGLVRQVQNPQELLTALSGQLAAPPDREKARAAFAAYLRTRQGGTRKIADFLVKELWGD